MQDNINTPNNVCQDESTSYASSIPLTFTVYTSIAPLGKEFTAQDNIIRKTTHGTMWSGKSETVTMTLPQLKDFIPTMGVNQALGQGLINDDIAHTANNLKIEKLAKLDPTAHHRGKACYSFSTAAGLWLLDYDGDKLTSVDAVMLQMLDLMPELHNVGMLALGSSSNGVYLVSNPEVRITKNGVHIYVAVSDASAIPQLNQLLKYRSWLAGLCDFKAGKASFLPDTFFDHAVSKAEHLIFENRTLGNGVAAEPRNVHYIEGNVLDVATMPFMTATQEQELNVRIEKARAIAKCETIAKMRDKGVSEADITKTIKCMDGGFLAPDTLLKGQNTGITSVADIVTAFHAGNGAEYESDTFIDPNDDIATCVKYRAKVKMYDSGITSMHSFADGEKTYILLADTSLLDDSDFLNGTVKTEPTQENTAKPDFWHDGNHNVNNTAEQQPKIKTLKDYAINGNSNAMEKELVNQTFILDGIAIAGHLTVIYAKPNTGKTLLVIKMLIDSIEAGRVNPVDVIYINADDNAHGLVTKLKLAEKHGFLMLSPGENGFKTKDFLLHIQNLIATNQARGTVIVLDTLKKFTDLMDKKVGSKFMDIARDFSLKGGSMILLAHTNKNRNKDGKAVFGGTSDIVDDCDGAFILDEVDKTELIKTVVFEKLKSRGTVEEEITFSYSVKPTEYPALIESVTRGDAAQAAQAKQFINKLSDKPAIEAILKCLANGTHKRTDILYMKHENVSRRVVEKCLDEYTGDLWKCEFGEKNSKIYYKQDPLPF
jgi:hypothetical protein